MQLQCVSAIDREEVDECESVNALRSYDSAPSADAFHC